jgi:hypothetical protein
MPCSNCYLTGHNARKCKTNQFFTYVDDEGHHMSIYRRDGLEDWMKPDDVMEEFFLGYEGEIWDSLEYADRDGRGLIYEQVIRIVRDICNRPRRRVNLGPHPPLRDGRIPPLPEPEQAPPPQPPQ